MKAEERAGIIWDSIICTRPPLYSGNDGDLSLSYLVKHICEAETEARQNEREECIKILEEADANPRSLMAYLIRVIRARGGG